MSGYNPLFQFLPNGSGSPNNNNNNNNITTTNQIYSHNHKQYPTFPPAQQQHRTLPHQNDQQQHSIVKLPSIIQQHLQIVTPPPAQQQQQQQQQGKEVFGMSKPDLLIINPPKLVSSPYSTQPAQRPQYNQQKHQVFYIPTSQPSSTLLSSQQHRQQEQQQQQQQHQADTKKKNRIRKACDTCHLKRVKCTGGEPCGNCSTLNLQCTYNRDEKRRGRASEKYPKEIKRRKAAVTSATGSVLNVEEVDDAKKKQKKEIAKKTVANEPSLKDKPSLLLPTTSTNFNIGFITRYPILETVKSELQSLKIPFVVADQLYEYYFTERPSAKLFNILKPSRMLKSSRQTKKSFLLTVLLISALEISDCDSFFSQNNKRNSVNRAIYEKIQDLLPSQVSDFEFDDLMTMVHLTYVMPWLSYSYDSLYWRRLACDVGLRLNLPQLESLEMNEDDKEELRRGWWSVYLLDRLISVGFNQDLSFSDDVCLDVCLPCDESLFIQSSPLVSLQRPKFKEIWNLQLKFDGVHDWFLPLCKLMGMFVTWKANYGDVELRDSMKEEFNRLQKLNHQKIENYKKDHEIENNVDVEYASYINLALTFLVEFDPRDETIGIFDIDTKLKQINVVNGNGSGTTSVSTSTSTFHHSSTEDSEEAQLIKDQLFLSTISKLTQCITILERISTLDLEFGQYPVIISFHLFIVGVSVLSTLSQIDPQRISKIPTFKYFIKTLIRVFESCMISFPGEFLRTVRNQLIWCIKDCDNLILLNDYYDEFVLNSKRRIEALKEFNWGPGAQGIGI